MSDVFFTSDHHFYHSNIINFCKRPFSSVEEMNEEMVKRWNEVVKPEDIVYHLGDVAMAHRAVTVFVPRLNGEKHLIMGNHDHCHPVHCKKEAKCQRMKQLYHDAGFKTIQLESHIMIGDQKVIMSHLPYSGDHTEKERYVEYRPKNEGGWLLCGHIHEKWKLKDKMYNVGVDVNNFYPVNIKEIEAIIYGN